MGNNEQMDQSHVDLARRESRIYKLCSAVTALWVLAGVLYAIVSGDNFLHMHPHEFSSFLSGWISPVGALWVVAAFLLQRAQLVLQMNQLEQNRREFRNEVAQMEREALLIRLNRLTERLLHSALRLLRKANLREFYLLKSGQREQIGQLFGSYKEFSEFFKSNEVNPVLSRLEKSLMEFVAYVEDDWVLHGKIEVIEEFYTELLTLTKIAQDIQMQVARIVPEPAECPEAGLLRKVLAALDKAGNTLFSMLHELRDIDTGHASIEGPKQIAASIAAGSR